MEAARKKQVDNSDLKQEFVAKTLEGYRSALNGDVEDAETFFERLMEKYPDEPKI